MLEPNAEPIDQVKERLLGLRGTRTLLRSRTFFVARIDKFESSETGFRFGGELLRSIAYPSESPRPCGNFEWCYTWDLLLGGNGVVFAPYVSWALYYDRQLINSVLGLMDADGSAEMEALRVIREWEAAREAKRGSL